MRLGLSVYGTVYSMGISRESGRPTIRPMELIDQALAYGIEGVEIPKKYTIEGEVESINICNVFLFE